MRRYLLRACKVRKKEDNNDGNAESHGDKSSRWMAASGFWNLPYVEIHTVRTWIPIAITLSPAAR